jgi:DNA-binding MarR family transcriptional regulator
VGDVTDPSKADPRAAGPDVDDLAHDLWLVTGGLVRALEGGNTLPIIPGAVLRFLDRQGAMTSSELAARRRVRPQTMAVTVKELLALGYVEGSPHPVDGRKVLLDITDAGREAVRVDRAGRVERLATGLRAGASAAELAAVLQALPVLVRLVEDLDGRLTEPLAADGSHPG